MSKIKLATTDPLELTMNKLNVMLYLLKNEIVSFEENGYPENHIFVKAVCANELYETEANSDLYKLYKLTEHMINNPNDFDKGEELSSLVNGLTECINELMDMYL